MSVAVGTGGKKLGSCGRALVPTWTSMTYGPGGPGAAICAAAGVPENMTSDTTQTAVRRTTSPLSSTVLEAAATEEFREILANSRFLLARLLDDAHAGAGTDTGGPSGDHRL